jgi:hypothetical protein
MSALPVLEQKWKIADAEARQEHVNAIDHWLAHTENLLEMFEADKGICTELRTVSGLLKTRKGDLESEIRKLTY